jgi:hypothetical protein
MGTGTFANHIVVPEIALARICKDAPFDKVCYMGCGVTTGVGAVLFAAKVEAGANVVVFGLGGTGLNVIQGARMVGADKIIGIDINPAREAMARQFGMTHFINSKAVPNVVDAIVRLTDGGADYSFDCIGNTTTMRQALGCCHKGWAAAASSAWWRRGPRSRPGLSNSSRATSGKAPPSAVPAAAPMCRRSSIGIWTARSASTRPSPTGWRCKTSTRASS